MTIKLHRLSSTCNEVHLHEATLYFSYETLVAVTNSTGSYKLDRYFSATTQRHITRMFMADAIPLDEGRFLEMVHLTLKESGR